MLYLDYSGRYHLIFIRWYEYIEQLCRHSSRLIDLAWADMKFSSIPQPGHELAKFITAHNLGP